MYYTTYISPIGELIIVSDGESIYNVAFCCQNSVNTDDYIENDNLEIFEDIKKFFDEYFTGKNPPVNFKLKPQGSDFRQKVWQILSQIPYGQTKTYGEIASEISPIMSAQAVGGAVGANPIVILIPCHRVLGKNNKLTGFNAGLDKKTSLLKIENIR